MNQVKISEIIVEDRMRHDYGDVAGLANSIKEYGLIQPIVLALAGINGTKVRLVAGGRRLAAMEVLKWDTIEYGKHYIFNKNVWNTDDGKLRLSAIELEENVRRKDMSWAEQVEAKQRLLELMQSIHGVSKNGRPSHKETATGIPDGFGVRKLAAMINEDPGHVQRDLQLAKMVRAMPQLKQQESKASAMRIGTVNVALHAIKLEGAKKEAAKAAVAAGPSKAAIATTLIEVKPEKKWELYEGPNMDSISLIKDESIDLIYTDLPYGVDLDKMGANENVSAHGGAISYSDSRDSIVSSLESLAMESFRVLKPHRFGVFFFGFNYYSELCSALTFAGFTINPIPFVWLKHQQFTQQPERRYANGYEQAIIASKGNAKFIRPGQVNIADVPGLRLVGRFQVAQQPVALVERFIQDMVLTGTGAKVLDFYSGTGTTGVAALQHGCYPILFEKDPEQCLIIRQRLENTLKSIQGAKK